MSEPVPFPEYEQLNPVAQQRIQGLATRFRLPPQKMLMVTMLMGRGVEWRTLVDACRMMGFPLGMRHLEEIRQEMSGWLSEEAHRAALIARLEKKGLLTEGRRECLRLATTREERMAVYFDAVPFEPLEGSHGDYSLFSEVKWSEILMEGVTRL